MESVDSDEDHVTANSATQRQRGRARPPPAPAPGHSPRPASRQGQKYTPTAAAAAAASPVVIGYRDGSVLPNRKVSVARSVRCLNVCIEKLAHTRLPSVGFRSSSRFLAVSLQMM